MSHEPPARPAVIVEVNGDAAGAGGPDRAELERRLTAGGVDLGRRMARAGEPVRLTLAPGGWEGLNLAALVALARARPGQPVQAGAVAGALVRGAGAGATFPPRPVLASAPRPETIFLDRDGTILEPVPYLNDPARVALLPGTAEGLLRLVRQGCRLVVLTNQSGVGRGSITDRELAAVHARMEELLAAAGVHLAGIFHCPHVPDVGCDCRKPASGMARAASERLGLDPARSLVVGDSAVDLGLARQLQVPGVLVLTGNGPATLASNAEPADFAVTDLMELADLCAHPAGLGVQPVTHPAVP